MMVRTGNTMRDKNSDERNGLATQRNQQSPAGLRAEPLPDADCGGSYLIKLLASLFVVIAGVDISSAQIRGDMNCDGAVDSADIAPFIDAVIDPAAWCAFYRHNMAYLLAVADFDYNGTLTRHDAVGFVPVLERAAGGRHSRDTRLDPSIDLNIDSDNNNGTGFPDHSAAEQATEANGIGKYVPLNDDDDNGNLVWDSFDEGPITDEEGELVPLVLRIVNPSSYAYQMRHNNSTDFMIWTSPHLGGRFTNPEYVLNYHSYSCENLLLGDLDCNDVCTFTDIGPFIEALSDPEGYVAHYPSCNRVNADVNVDGIVDFDDIEPFVAHLDDPNKTYVVRMWVEARADESGSAIDATLGTQWQNWDRVQVTTVDVYGCDTYAYALPGFSCDQPRFISRCGHAYVEGEVGAAALNTGRLNLLPSNLFGPGDFPPTTASSEESSLPMISRSVVQYGGPAAFATRPTLNGVVDLVLGQPLVQDTDLTLPFGSATFRHVRTWGENLCDQGLGNQFAQQEVATFWDWNGLGWSMGENPIFLIDYADPAVVRVGSDLKRCYFIPDAHHAIPFIWDAPQHRYFAPPYFDATLTFDDDDVNDDIPPTAFYVTMARQSIKYTITPIYEDLYDSERPVEYGTKGSVHNPPPADDPMHGAAYATHGRPYYGLVTAIEDRFGNRIEYTYCPFTQFTADHAATPDCVECGQNCPEKGQLQALKLRAATGQVVWTVLYVYRAFGYPPTPPHESEENWYQHALHSMHAYAGDVPVPEQCLTIPAETFYNVVAAVDPFDPGMALSALDGVEHAALPANWVHEVKYLYGDVSNYMPAPAATLFDKCFSGPGVRLGRLLKVTRSDRAISGATEQQKHVLYRYSEVPTGIHSASLRLAMVFGNATIESIIHALGAQASPNTLITMDDMAQIPFVDPNGVPQMRRLQDVADLRFTRWDINGFAGPLNRELVEDYLLSDTDHARVCQATIKSFRDGRSSQPNGGSYDIYPYVVGYEHGGMIQAGALRYPFREGSAIFDPDVVPLEHPFHAIVIDHKDDAGKLVTRRVVEMNAAGFVLSDRTWESEQPDPGEPPTFQFGYAERRQYDCHGRLKQTRTRGWSSAENPDVNSEGLIYVYGYEPDVGACDCDEEFQFLGCDVGELKTVGFKRGEQGAVYYTKRFEHNVPGHNELVTKAYGFPIPTTDSNSSAGNCTETQYIFDTADRLVGKTTIKPAAPRTAGGAAYYAVERERSDVYGNVQWHGIGCLSNPSDLGSAIEFYVTHTVYDSMGRPTLTVTDTDQYSLPGLFQRVGSTVALNETTSYEYEEPWGMRRMVHPNGRERRFVYRRVEGTDEVEQRIYSDVIFSGGTWETLSPVEISRYSGSGRLLWKKRVHLTGTGSSPSQPCGDEPYEALSTNTLTYDASGHAIGVQQAADGETSLSAARSYDAYGRLTRERAVDGSISRYLYDGQGRLERTYRGTNDDHPFWNTVEPCDPCAPCSYADNLWLVEMRYYGSGVGDAGKLATLRRYRDKPDNQYFAWDPNRCKPGEQPGHCTGWWENGVVPNEDEIGWATNYLYDWRMRPVWVTTNGSSGSPVEHTITWYDSLDRPVVIATFGESALVGGLDPRLLPTAWPTDGTQQTAVAQALVQCLPSPTSVVELVYNARGMVEETRNWRLVEGEPDYTASLIYYDHRGRVVESRAPNAPTQQFTYDGKGRQVSARTLAGDQVVAETKTVCDMNDRAIESIWRERSEDGQYVESFVQTWYDKVGRTVATTNYGTNTDNYAAGGQRPGYNPSQWPALGVPGVLVTEYEYDEGGRRCLVRDHRGVENRSLYDGFGRLRLYTENTQGAGAARRRTAYQYDEYGRLSGIAAVLPGYPAVTLDNLDVIFADPAPANVQVTRLVYNAFVFPSTWSMQGGSGWSVNWGYQSVNATWVSDVVYPNGNSLHFSYYSDGSVAYRADSRGNEAFYQYDVRGQLTDIWVDDLPYYSPPPDWEPANRVHHVRNEYDERGRLHSCTAYGWTTQDIIAQSQCDYSDVGALEREAQQHFGAVQSSSPAVSYARDFADQLGGNFDRLASITYPGGDTTVSLDYDADPLSDVLSRVTSISSNGVPRALYGYIGTSRRVSTVYGNGVVQSFGADGAYPGLDRFGRVIDQNFMLDSQPLYRYQYGYDAADNRVHTRRLQAGIGLPLHDNDRSFLYVYDELNRLTGAHLGRLNASNDDIVADVNVALARQLGWTLDNLGNWTGADGAPGLFRDDDVDGDGDPDHTQDVSHTVDPANEIEAVTRIEDGGPPMVQALVYDLAGNLVFDGRLFYQYDGLNRLVQVNEAAALEATDFDIEGRLIANAPPPPLGPILAECVYDGLGRLIHMVRHDPQDGGQTADYYYDGVRRVQEVEVTDLPGAQATTATREYVYGPEYVDELVCQLNESGQPIYVLQDAHYNVAALLDAAGNALWQYVYEPYGQPVFADAHPTLPLPTSRVGHQGLFFERLCVHSGDSVTDPALTPDAVGLYYNRNRWYSPELGRFLQRDMKETAQWVQAASTMNGAASGLAVTPFSALSHYGDGMNLYAYLGSNPVNRQDALGLDWGMDDDIDNTIAAINGERAAAAAVAAAQIGMALNTAHLIGGMAFSMMPGADALRLAMLLARGESVGWDDLIGAGLDLSGPLGKTASVFMGMVHEYKLGVRAGKYLKVANQAIDGFEHLFKILPYKDAQKLTAGWNHSIEAHHLLERRFAGLLHVSTDELPAVILTKEMHNQVSNALRSIKASATVAELRATYRDVYTKLGHAEWFQAIERYLK